MAEEVYYSITADGEVSSKGYNYSDSRQGVTSFAYNSNLHYATVGQEGDNGFGEWYCYQAFIGFLTNNIPGDATITAVTLSLCTNATNSSGTDFTVEARIKDWGGTVTQADYVPGDSLSGYTLVASKAASALSAVNSYTDFTSETAFLTNINRSGTTYLFLSSSRTRLGNEPAEGVNEEVRFYMEDEERTTRDPKLVITYTLPEANVFRTLPVIPVE